MANVLHLIETLDYGGAEQVLLQLVRAQSTNGHRVAVCCLKRFGALADELPAEVERICLDKGEGDEPAVIWRLSRHMRRLAVEVVHTHAWGVFLEGGLASWLAGVRTLVHTAHGPYRRREQGVVASVKWHARRWLELGTARRFHALVGVSDSISRKLCELGFRVVDVRTIRNGVPPRPRAAKREPGSELVLMAVGRLATVKDQAAMIRAVAALSPGLALRLRIVGDGPERERLQRLADDHGVADRVEFLGFRDDVPELLESADIFLLTSRHEGISIALLEAMRAGLPVIASSVGGVPETVIDGQSGVLVAAGADEQLHRAIELLALSEAERLRLGGNAARRVAERFSVEATAAAYEGLYSRVTATEVALPAPLPVVGPLRILYHHRTQGRGAEGLHIARIVGALAAMGHEVTVVSPPGVDPLATAGSAPVDKAEVTTRGMGSIWKLMSRLLPGVAFELAEIAYNLIAWSRLRRVLARGSYDLVYERYAFYLVAGALLARRHGIPFVLEANEVSGLAERARRQWFPRLAGAFERFVFRRCTALLTVSSYLREQTLRQGVEPERIHVLPNAIDSAALQPVARDPDLVSRYGLNGRTVIGFAGWFDRWDRLDLLIEALQRLRSSNPSLVVLLIGDGPLLEPLRERARGMGLEGAVVTCGAVPRDQIQQHLALLDIAVLPHSNQFGSPVVMFEFMARRVPIVAPRLPPIEDVLVDGESALLFEPLDQDQLVTAVARYLASPRLRKAMASAAFELLISRHTWDHNAARVLEAAGLPVPMKEDRRAS